LALPQNSTSAKNRLRADMLHSTTTVWQSPSATIKSCSILSERGRSPICACKGATYCQHCLAPKGANRSPLLRRQIQAPGYRGPTEQACSANHSTSRTASPFRFSLRRFRTLKTLLSSVTSTSGTSTSSDTSPLYAVNQKFAYEARGSALCHKLSCACRQHADAPLLKCTETRTLV
jgi:hypothetical protein